MENCHSKKNPERPVFSLHATLEARSQLSVSDERRVTSLITNTGANTVINDRGACKRNQLWK